MKIQDNFSVLSDKEPQRKWIYNRYFWISAIFSAVWVVFMAHYLATSGWWQNRIDLSPAELVGGLGGLALPMVLAWLVCAYFDRTDQLESEGKVLRSYLNELVYPTEEGAIYTRTLTDALRAQIKEFRSVFQDVNEQTQAVRDDLKYWVRDLSAVIKHVDGKTMAIIREIAGHIQGLADATTAANTQVEKTSNMFSEQAAILARVTDGAVQATAALSQSLSNNTAEIQALMQEIQSVNEQTGQAVARSEQVILSLNQTGTKIEESINLYETSARQQNARLFGNLEKVLSVFRAHGDLLEQEVSRTTNRLTEVEKALKEQVTDIMMITDKAMQKVDETNLTLGNTKEELAGALTTFKTEATSITQQIEKATKKMTTLPSVHQIQTGNLLQEASGILTRLQEFSVDMAHLFSPKSEELLWERYYNGDKTVFMRHIQAELTPTKQKKLKDLYKTDKGFKKSVDQYMNAFENMTQTLSQGDDSKLLMSIVIGSDVGRLYMVLANILKGKK